MNLQVSQLSEKVIMKRPRKCFRVWVMMIASIAAFSGWSSPLAVAQKSTDQEKRARVEVTTPKRQTVTRSALIPATLLPYESADLYAKASGYITSVSVDIGHRVKRGDPLIEIDVPEMADELRQEEAVLQAKRAMVRAAKAMVGQAMSKITTAQAHHKRDAADHMLAKITLSRQQQLRDENVIPEQLFDEAQSRFSMAEAQLQSSQAMITSAEAEVESAKADEAVAQAEVAVEEARVARLETLIKYAVIRAPFDGVITERMVDPGAFVRSAEEGTTTPLLTISKVRKLRVALEIPEVDVPYVRAGTEVEIVVRAVSRDPISAVISRTAVALKPETRSMRAEVDLDNEDELFAPGMYAQVTITLESKQEAMVVPARAIRVNNKIVSVWVAENSIVKAKPITIGYDDGIWVEVLGGLTGDEQIIVASNGVIAPGARVITSKASG